SLRTLPRAPPIVVTGACQVAVSIGAQKGKIRRPSRSAAIQPSRIKDRVPAERAIAKAAPRYALLLHLAGLDSIGGQSIRRDEQELRIGHHVKHGVVRG